MNRTLSVVYVLQLLLQADGHQKSFVISVSPQLGVELYGSIASNQFLVFSFDYCERVLDVAAEFVVLWKTELVL